jgi:hypothetical protein
LISATGTEFDSLDMDAIGLDKVTKNFYGDEGGFVPVAIMGAA